MRSSRALALPALVCLLLSAPSCSTVIGIDADYTDLVAGSEDQGGAAGSGLGGRSGASAGTAGALAQAGSNAQGGAAGSAATCSGVSSSGVCWHLGDLGASCQETCAKRGGVAPAAASVVGTTAQGGSLQKCTTLLSALGESSKPTEATRADDNGVGCHYYGLKAYWLSAPDFTPTAHLNSARLACGCLQ